MDSDERKFIKNSDDKKKSDLDESLKKSKEFNFILIFFFISIAICLITILFTTINFWFYFIKNIFDIIFTSLKSITRNNDSNYFNKYDYYGNEEYKLESLKNGQNFFNICIKGELIKEIPNNKDIKEKPLISVVLPVYNTGENIKSVVRSAQNQNISNIEIILVNDFSNNETNKAIKELIREDQRIQCINNKRNMGTLYSRCIGTLNSKGKYIFPLDNDDYFFDEGLFHIITNEAEIGNFDIVEFRGASREIYHLPPNNFQNTNYSNHQNGLILYQPELGQYSTKRGNQFGIFDCFLWGKCIRNEVYKTTINTF